MNRAPKILYAVQGTGNGHVARAREVIPILQQYGDVDVLLSGNQSEVNLPIKPKFRSKGLIFIYNSKGGISYIKTLLKNNFIKIFLEVCAFPVRDYDIVINDFESITAWASLLKGKTCFGLGHQASFQSELCPEPRKKDLLGRFILKNYSPCSSYVGFHFDRYDQFVFTPVIRNEVREIKPSNKGHYTVYLPAFGNEEIESILNKLENVKWEVFSKHTSEITMRANVTFYPISNAGFVKSFSESEGVLTSAGFETPAEALYLGKKLMLIPIKGQYEQFCNAEAAKQTGVPIMYNLDEKAIPKIEDWVLNTKPIKVDYPNITEFLIYSFIIEPWQKDSKEIVLANN
ncbi:glycosyltransferase family protein [Owenweeksia hongkongensis]|uniref:glycosyltransferase family protein n=1 Tax=Owenweeksia hongkongensis TaxID=253245 RepID=UPI003A8F1E5C